MASVNQPPLGMASRALRIRLKKTCWRRFSLPRTAGRSASSLRTLMRPRSSWCSSSESTSSSTLLMSRLSNSALDEREKLSRLLMILAARKVCFSIFSRRAERASSPGICWRSICV